MASFIKDIEEIRERARRKIDEGAVTEAYGLDKDRAVEVLNEALATEIVCVLRYMHHYFMATGVHGRAVADEFKAHADEEREHADELAERIQQLGGKPDFNPASLLQRSVSHYVEGETLADMIREDLIAERTVIDVYQEMIEFFGHKDPTTRRMLEHIKAEEEEHASDLSDFLFIVDPRSGETAGRDPGTTPLEHRGTQDRSDGGKMGKQQGSSGNRPKNIANQTEEKNALRRSGSTDARGADIGGSEVAEVGEALAGLEQPVSSRQPSGGDRTRAVSVSPTGKSEMRPARDRGAAKRDEREPFAGRGTVEAPASNLPGVGGRTMNRRRTADEIDERDVAKRPNVGASGGTNRSPKILNKSRKNKRAA